MKYVKSGFLLLLDALLTVCQQEANQTTYQSLPKFSLNTQQMRLQTSNNAVTKAKLTVKEGIKIEEGRILDTPTNLPSPLSKRLGLILLYLQMASRVSICHQRLLPTKQNSESIERNATALTQPSLTSRMTMAKLSPKSTPDNAMVKENIVRWFKAVSRHLKPTKFIRLPSYCYSRITGWQKHPDLPSIHVETGNIWSDGNGFSSLTPLEVWKCYRCFISS